MSKNSSKITALVTGGAGFLGSHLCERLLDAGSAVICLDNLQTGSVNNITNLMKNSNFKFIEHDVVEPIDIEVNQIYNLACPASPPHYQESPIRTTKTCVIGAINMLDLAKNNNARILQASTSEVYGDPSVHPQHEQYFGNVNITGPRACYDEGKRCAESLFFDYQRSNNVDIKVARIFNTYGPRMHPNDGRVVSNFIMQALRGEELTIYGTGQQTRSFCYVDDLVEGIMRLMHSDSVISGPINLGNPSEFTMLQLAQLILKLVDSKSTLKFLPIPEDDPKQRKPDISLAGDQLLWSPLVSLEDGLARTIEYFSK